MRELLEGLVDASFERPAAMLAGRLNAEFRDGGTTIDVEVVMIGAIALDRDEPVLTRNAADFEQLPGLEVESY